MIPDFSSQRLDPWAHQLLAEVGLWPRLYGLFSTALFSATLHLGYNMYMDKVSNIFSKVNVFFQWLILPREIIAGLEFKDTALRIAQMENGVFKKEGFLLEPGIIEDGIVKDKARLIVHLKALRAQFAPEKKEKIPVIAIIPSALIYTQVFSLPTLGEESKIEAIKLNLQSLSPIDFNQVYSDWEQLDAKDRKEEFLSAFARKDIVNAYVEAMQESGFTPVAIEFPALAISRAMKESAVGVDFKKPQIVVNITSDGIDFMVFKNGNVYFEYFTSWKLVQVGAGAREISFDDFKETILRELKKVGTFYTSHWGGSLQDLILLTQAFETETTQFIESQLHYTVTKLVLRGYEDTPLSWVAVIGAALRGTVRRANDIFISLVAVGTEDGYLYTQIIFLVRFWRNVLLTTACFFIIMFVIVDSFLARTYVNIVDRVQSTTWLPSGTEVDQLQKNAKLFNSLVDKTAFARQNSSVWSPFFNKINEGAQKITFTHIGLDIAQRGGFLIGKAPGETEVSDFKSKLIQAGIQNINLPLSKTEQNSDGTITFSLTFSI